MDEKEGKVFVDRAEKIVQGLTNALADEIRKLNDDEFSNELMLYAMAKFSANALLSIQEQTLQFDIEDGYAETIKELMAIMGKNERIQSIKNGRREIEKKLAESEKIIAEREKRVKALEDEYKQSVTDDGLQN